MTAVTIRNGRMRLHDPETGHWMVVDAPDKLDTMDATTSIDLEEDLLLQLEINGLGFVKVRNARLIDDGLSAMQLESRDKTAADCFMRLIDELPTLLNNHLRQTIKKDRP